MPGVLDESARPLINSAVFQRMLLIFAMNRQKDDKDSACFTGRAVYTHVTPYQNWDSDL